MWVKLSDDMPEHAKFQMLTKVADNERLLAKWVKLATWSNRSRTDGFIPAHVVKRVCSWKFLAAMRATITYHAPILHERGDDCPCLEDQPWPDGFDYRLHQFLDYQPKGSEYDLERVQRSERENAELRDRLRLRDRDLCRYCGTAVSPAKRGPNMLTVDHVDPTKSGEPNLVIACKGCNSKKGKRLPHEAGMSLLVPGTRRDDDGRLTLPAPQAPTDTEAPQGEGEGDLRAVTDELKGPAPGRVGSGNKPATEEDADANVNPPPTTAARHVRTKAEGNPYLREARDGLRPEYHAGLAPEAPRQQRRGTP